MSTQLRKGVLEICVLTLINSKDMYGYEIVESISKVMDVKESTIYPLLRRLTSEGNFETYIQKSEGGPDRKYYKITDYGKSNLKDMVNEWDRFVQDVNFILERYRKESIKFE
ncbi:PadR family transcriptional regulator [Clostridium senegalense]|uniref:PadR family transcriptional regulator n=1 Tax=Clostridium senegalense TaxID=1465809 RepID=UPI000288E095|nr:PadR family transcriptional regulator [Clostridium senegalense]